MARKISMATLFVVLAATLLQSTFAATYTVGDSTGWIMPTNNADLYDNWDDNKDFVVGDILGEFLSSKSNLIKILFY